jgi:hypothetical protein
MAARPWIRVLWIDALRAVQAKSLKQKKRKQKAWAFCTAVATHMDNASGRASVSFVDLAEETGFSEDFLQAGSKAARELGFLHAKGRLQTEGEHRGQRGVTVYHARFPRRLQPDGYRRRGDGWELDPSWDGGQTAADGLVENHTAAGGLVEHQAAAGGPLLAVAIPTEHMKNGEGGLPSGQPDYDGGGGRRADEESSSLNKPPERKTIRWKPGHERCPDHAEPTPTCARCHHLVNQGSAEEAP